MNFSINDGGDDDFGGNPFRTGNSDPFAPQQQPTNLQPDPYSGMTGTLDMAAPPPQPQQPPPQDPSLWSGSMDQRAPATENYGTNAGPAIESTPFNAFSWRSWVACCRIDAYSKYFDIDTVDVNLRLRASLWQFYLPDQFRTAVVGDVPTENLKGPDLYGPVWICATLVFALAASSNVYAFWEHSKKQAAASEGTAVEAFEVDIDHLLHACNVVLVFVFGMSSAFWLAASCMGMPGISWGLWVCVYGYSQTPFLVAAPLVCIFPLHIVTWLLIMGAATASAALVVRNLATPLMAQDTGSNTKAGPLILAMLVVHFVYFLVIKFRFFP